MNVQVVDEDGNSVDNITAYLRDSSNSLAAGWTTGNGTVNSYGDYEIASETYFYEPRSTFEALVAPYALETLTQEGKRFF